MIEFSTPDGTEPSDLRRKGLYHEVHEPRSGHGHSTVVDKHRLEIQVLHTDGAVAETCSHIISIEQYICHVQISYSTKITKSSIDNVHGAVEECCNRSNRQNLATMAKARKKKRSQPGGANGLVPGKPGTSNRLQIPQSMVIRMGAADIGSSVSQLAADFREAVQPHTAARLKERRSNRLRDYTTMAGPLGVTHSFLHPSRAQLLSTIPSNTKALIDTAAQHSDRFTIYQTTGSGLLKDPS